MNFNMKVKYLFLLLAFLTVDLFSVGAAADYSDITNFLKKYEESEEKRILHWPEIAYAIEKDYSDEVALFCMENFLKKEDPTQINTRSSMLYFASNADKDRRIDGSETCRKSVLITCVRKNRPNILKALLQKYEDCFLKHNRPDRTLQRNFFRDKTVEYSLKHYWIHPLSVKTPQKIKERYILNIAIEESEHSELFIGILNCFAGIDVNFVETYEVPQSPGYLLHSQHMRTPLCAAVMKGKEKDVQLLLENGACPNPRNPSQVRGYGIQLPLYTAIHQGRPDIAEMLLKHGADPKGMLAHALSFLSKQKRSIAIQIIKLLLSYGANPKEVLKEALLMDDQEIRSLILNAIDKV